jgi:predicted O-methyltransferase YrrM
MLATEEREELRSLFQRFAEAEELHRPHYLSSMPTKTARKLYRLLRERRPSVCVETGVCNGTSSAIILQALERNGHGRLYSIDFPEFTDSTGEFWHPGGAVIPQGKEPGWLVPENLRGRWELTLGRSQDELEPLLDRLGTIDFFLHDSEHSYECMTFEFSAVMPRLRDGGVLVSDDADWNSAFKDFAAKVGRGVETLETLALIEK